VQAADLLIATTPIVARLVIITQFAGNRCAELFSSPSGVIFFDERNMNIAPAAVKSDGEYQTTSPPSQYSATEVEGVPPPKTCTTSPIPSTSLGINDGIAHPGHCRHLKV